MTYAATAPPSLHENTRHEVRLSSKQWMGWWFLLATYYFLLLALYDTVIAELWGYYGFIKNPSVGAAIISVGALGFFAAVFTKARTPSYFFFQLTILIVAIPLLVVVTGSGAALTTITVLGVAMGVLALTLRIVPPVILRIWPGFKRPVEAMLYVVIYGTLAGLAVINGTRYFNLDIFAVYEYRSDISSGLPIIFSYLNSSATKVAIPFLLATAIVRRKRWVAASLVLASVAFFALTAHKAPLFYPVATIALVYGAQSGKAIRWVIFGLLTIVVCSFLEIYFTNSLTITTLLPRRALLLPALLNSLYVDFFSSQPFNWWSDSRITFGLLDISYADGIAHTIGAEQFGKPNMGANTGWIGSGYAQAGYLGVILYSAMLGVALRMTDGAQRSLGYETVVAMYVVPISSVILSSDFLTGLLNHGLLFSLLLPGILSGRAHRDINETSRRDPEAQRELRDYY